MRNLRARLRDYGRQLGPWHRNRRLGNGRRPPRDDGMNTAEYAVGTLAAVAFAGVLLKVLTSDAVRNALSSIVQRALQ